MAFTRITPIEATAAYFAEGSTPQMATITAVASDVTNGNIISLSSNILLVLENTTVGAETVTVTSYPDGFGRVANITAFSIGAGVRVARFFKRPSWGNGGGDLEILTSDVGIEVEAFKL